MLVRKRLAHEFHIVEHRVAAAPRLVPVITNAPNVLRSSRIGQYRLHALIDEITVVIPRDYFLVRQTFPLDCWTKMVLQKISLLLCGENARLPFLCCHRLVLNGDTPDGYAFTLVSLDELHEVVGPRLIKLRFQSPTMKHVVVIFHECRWTPRTAEDVELSARRCYCLFDKWNPKLLVVLDAERLQLLVALVYVGVARIREITTVNVRSRERVADAFIGIEIGIQQFLLFHGRKFGEGFG